MSVRAIHNLIALKVLDFREDYLYHLVEINLRLVFLVPET